MNLTPKSTVKSLLKKYQIRPSKRLGQNFLIDWGAVRRIVEAAELKPPDLVLEIGPGVGVLTKELAKRVKKLVAVEKDPQMVEVLKETLREYKNVEIVKRDIRKIKSEDMGIRPPYKVVGNLPFYLTAPVIRQFLESTEARPLYAMPELMVLVVQKEVGQRICARPPRMNLLAVSVQFYAEPKIISYISKKSFWPQPEVDAAVIKISNFKSQISKINKDLFFKIVKAGFSQPRKQLINNLSRSLRVDKIKMKDWLLNNKILPQQRAETLSIKDWIKLAKNLN
ncbi:MAG: ribosomal RNA small subunit methyltransferase A [Candidatus Nealsonbacteria bacterium]|nr:MAG: ribosomal RNA small subunit methyltransferase A [Candidatus Nealsonbacteria bacterium]